MEKMIARCGIICSDCGAFIATKTGDEKLRKKNGKRMVENVQCGHQTGRCLL